MGLFKRNKDTSPQRRLLEIVGDSDIPHFPKATMQILRKLRDENADSEAIADSLQWDPGLVVKVLATVNTAAYGTRAPIEDVRHAVSFLGRSQLEQLVLAIAVRGVLPAPATAGFESARFWHAAAYRAGLARALAERLHPAQQAESFTAGLLQDLALPVLARAHPTSYGTLLCEWHAATDTSLAELERGTLGWCHGEVGGLLADAWGLPDGLARAIRHHHSPSDVPGDDAGAVVPAVGLVALLHESRVEESLEVLIEAAREGYSLPSDWVRAAFERCADDARELAALLAA